MESFVNAITLSGEDAVRFAESFYNPGEDYIRHFKKHLDAIDEHISIRETEDGYDVEIPDLDLSFLNEKSSSSTFNFTDEFKIEIQSKFINNGEKTVEVTKESIRINDCFIKSVSDEYIPSAA